MGDNPAAFKESLSNPVETVSWDDVQQFIIKLNGLVPGLNACLPTEAQWEYACRAGTPTPFSFGKNITPEQVNYDGNYPYTGGEKGLFRRKTVPVKSLPANPWRLHEMHGNILEWCSDWYGDYPTEAVIDPCGSPEALSGCCVAAPGAASAGTPVPPPVAGSRRVIAPGASVSVLP